MQELKGDLLERANQIVSLCQNADAIANQTMMTLADQHEQLVNVQTHLISMDTTLNETQKDINRLKGLTQRVIKTFRTKFHGKILAKLYTHSKQKSNSPLHRRPMPLKPMEPNILQSDSVTDQQIDQVFCQIGHWISSLKDKAYTINDQLAGDAILIDDIHECMGESTHHIRQQNVDMRKISLTN